MPSTEVILTDNVPGLGAEADVVKVRRGYAMWEMPAGFVRTEEHRIEKIADRQVQQVLEGVFRKFRQLGGAQTAHRGASGSVADTPGARARRVSTA